MQGDIGWLRKSLAQALGWDEQLTEGVAEAIAAAGSRQEVEELAQVPCQVADAWSVAHISVSGRRRPVPYRCANCRITWEEVTRCTAS